MDTTLKAYYDGTAFVPVKSMKSLDIRKGEVFTLSILQDSAVTESTAKKLKILQRITDNLRKLNDTEPLSPEFDMILSQRIHLKEKIGI
jgi:hypothetical protein